MKRFLISVICCAGFAPGAVAQSFDCSGRLSIDEQTVCDSGTLSRLDTELTDVYEDVLSKASDRERERLRAEQRDWIGTRAACRDRKICLTRLYRDRISELEDKSERTGGSTRLGEASDGRDRWSALGSVDVGEDTEELTILVGFSRGRFDALQLRVRDSRTRIRRLRVVYGNGTSQKFKFRRRFRAGQLSDTIELRGRRAGRFIERVEIEARSRRGARIDVIGRRSGRGLIDERPLARDQDRYRDDRRRYSDRDDTAGDGRYIDRDRYADRDPSRFNNRDFGDRRDRDDDYDRDSDRDFDREEDRRDDRYGSLDDDERADYRDQERAVVSRQRLLDFVKNVFHRTAEMSARELRETYAARVDYYGDRRKSVDDIVKDKRNYRERWDDRAFRVRGETFEYEETSEPGVYEVTYTYDFHVRGNGRERKGVGETTLLVDANGERYVILKEDGKVTKRL